MPAAPSSRSIVALIFAVFDPVVGPLVLHQVPEGSVATALSTFPSRPAPPVPLSPPTPSSSALVRETSDQAGLGNTQVLFDFASIQNWVIPAKELCNHLITKATRGNKILGFPVRIENEEKYQRNAFIFNLCFVFQRDVELSSFEPIVRKAARVLRMAEESTSLLSNPPPSFSIANLIEQILLDINAYSETSIALPDARLDLILFPFYANPVEVHNSDVPLAVSRIEEMSNRSWDLTMFKLVPFIDGVNSVKRIAELAEVELGLARSCIQHLLFYSAIIIVDLFRYSNSYAAVAGITDTPQQGEEEDEGLTELVAECEEYVYAPSASNEPPVPYATLLALYSHLRPGLSVSAWIEQHNIDALPLDVRRMIQFGVIKSFLRRVHCYPLWLDHPDFRPPHPPRMGKLADEPHGTDMGSLTLSHPRTESPLQPSIANSSSISMQDAPAAPRPLRPSPTPSILPPLPSIGPTNGRRLRYPSSLKLLLNGAHHEEEICVRYGITKEHLEEILRDVGGVSLGSGEEGFGRVSLIYV